MDFDAEVPACQGGGGVPHAGAAVLLHGRRARGGTIEFRAAVKAEKAARGAQPEEEERTDGELNWVQRARLASEVAAQKHRVKG